ncbi:MAG: hypothetical protein ACRCYO_13460 [Bacteroidia bacterium]
MGELANDKFPKERFGLITGSRCTPLFPKKSAEVGQRQLAKELANEMFFQFYDETSTRHTDHGEYAEGFALEYFQKHHCKEAIRPEFIRDGDHGGSGDCLAPLYGADFKCPTSLKKWLDYLHEGIDEDQYNQCQMYMRLYNRPKWYVAAFLIETLWMNDWGLKYPVPEDKRMILIEVKRSEEWNTKLDDITPKIIKMRDFFYDKLVNQFSQWKTPTT